LYLFDLSQLLQDELLAELEEMEQAELDENLLNVGTTSNLEDFPEESIPNLPSVRKSLTISSTTQ
jgi:charged multivesicular body protein 4